MRKEESHEEGTFGILALATALGSGSPILGLPPAEARVPTGAGDFSRAWPADYLAGAVIGGMASSAYGYGPGYGYYGGYGPGYYGGSPRPITADTMAVVTRRPTMAAATTANLIIPWFAIVA